MNGMIDVFRDRLMDLAFNNWQLELQDRSSDFLAGGMTFLPYVLFALFLLVLPLLLAAVAFGAALNETMR